MAADYATDDTAPAGVFRPPVSRIAGWLGAVTSLALVAGMGFWVFDLATRDTRTVPVVRAMEGPMRTAPESPGGFKAAHMGLEVNRIASDVDDAPLADRVALAPPPTPVTEDDLPLGAAPPVVDAAEVRSAIDATLSGLLGENEGAGDPAVDAEEPGAAVHPAPGVPSRSFRGQRPVARPDPDLVTRASVTFEPLLPVASGPLDPAAIAPGTPLVQLGAFDSPEVANEVWASLSDRFEGYLAGRQQVVEQAVVGGRTFFRLRAHGFDDLASARAFCAVFEAERAECIPVVAR